MRSRSSGRRGKSGGKSGKAGSCASSLLPHLLTLGYLHRRSRLPTVPPGAILDLPSEHRIPLTWLLENAGASIRYRTYRELAPEGYAAPEVIQAAQLAVADSKTALGVVKKQKDNGIWGGNLLGLATSAAQGIKDVGTIPQYRRLLQRGRSDSHGDACARGARQQLDQARSNW